MMPRRALHNGFRPVNIRAAKDAGLFGLPGLHTASDWALIASDCLSQAEQTAKAIRATASSPTSRTLQLFDDLSNILCTVLDT